MPAVPTMSTPIWLRPLLLAGALLSPPASCLAAPIAAASAAAALAPTAIPAPASSVATKAKTHARPSAPPPGMPQFGAGAYGRYLVLKVQGPTGPQLAPHTPYRLFLTGKDQSIRNTPDGSGVIHGVTDAQGRTAWIWTETDHLARDFTLVRLAGDYSWGQVFQLSSSGEHAPVAGYPYRIALHQRWGELQTDMGYTSAQGNTAYVSDAMPAASLNLYTSNDFDFDPACFTELNMLNLELARRDLDAARERVAAMGCADAPAGKVALATVLLGAGQPEWARRTVEEATAPAWIERISPLDDQALADRYMLHKLLGMPDAALADAMELQRRQARKSGRPDPDYANSVAYYLADFPDYLPQAEAQARRSIRAAGLRPYNQATLGWIRFLRGDAAGGLDMLKRGYAAQPRDEEMVADYGLALWRDGQQALARRIWDQAEAQCVWGRRLYDALRAVDYPHPLFHASDSAQVQAYQQRCAQPRPTRDKRHPRGAAA